MTTSPTMDRRLVLLFAVACGASVANLYYAQPLLDRIADDLDVSPGAAGLLVTASQIGYALGLVTIVPLGDLIARHRLVAPLMALCTLALLGAAAAPNLPVLLLAVLGVGVTAVVAQVLVPLAGALAADHERGTVVGTVMSGLLIGILAARTISGLLAAVAGWRTVYVAAAGLCALLGIVLHRMLPRLPVADPALTYRGLVRSLWPLVRDEPVVRRRMVYGALGMAGFTVVWTSLAFLMAEDYGKGEAETGLLGLAGLFGAVAALGAGRLADRGWAHRSTGSFLLCVALGWALLWAGGESIAALVAGLVLVDLGMQGQHITNQSILYALRPEARSRLTTLYMTGNFAAGAVASAFAGVAWSAGGWDAVCLVGGGLALVGCLVWLDEHVRAHPATARRS
ncbi:MFS transporter [Sporichthya polymorpha]|uniref:MFS transporter n=1 Tax=Sporichthya polymorpha TaxID=35751 RepID=UPI00039F5ACA|nr:MFS transporter [Sporichthya polymorpha]